MIPNLSTCSLGNIQKSDKRTLPGGTTGNTGKSLPSHEMMQGFEFVQVKLEEPNISQNAQPASKEYYHTAVFLTLLKVEFRNTSIKRKILVSTEVAPVKQMSRAREMNQFTCPDNVQSHFIDFR